MQLLLWTHELSLGLPALISWQIKNISLQLLWCCPVVGGGEDTGGTVEGQCLVDWVAVRGRGLGILIPGFQKWLVIASLV